MISSNFASSVGVESSGSRSSTYGPAHRAAREYPYIAAAAPLLGDVDEETISGVLLQMVLDGIERWAQDRARPEWSSHVGLSHLGLTGQILSQSPGRHVASGFPSFAFRPQPARGPAMLILADCGAYRRGRHTWTRTPRLTTMV